MTSADHSEKCEEVQLQVDSVKIRQGGVGCIVLFSTRLEWKGAPGTDVPLCRYDYSNIKGQKVSPESKDKVQLQLVLSDSSTATFQFLNPEGKPAQLRDRETVKEFLLKILIGNRNPPRSDEVLEQKQKLLSENADHFRLYKDLVPTGIISADHFWKHIANTLTTKDKESQDIGIPSGFLVNLTSTDGCNGIKLNLTADTLGAIFRAYPAVARKHAEVVPHKMSEQSFWSEFFQSHYFHRDRQTNPSELFSDSAAPDMPTLDINNDAQHLKLFNFDLLQLMDEPVDTEGYGSRKDETEAIALSDKVGPDAKVPKTTLIRRFNEHSARVLLASTITKEESTSAHNLKQIHFSSRKRTTDSEDLASPETQSYSFLPLLNGIRPTGSPFATGSLQKRKKLEMTGKASCDKVALNEEALHSALLQLLMNDDQIFPSSNLGSPTNAEIIRLVQLSLLELLRHFWSAFPTTTVELEEKVERMFVALQKFQLQKLSSTLMTSNPEFHKSLEHIESMLKAAKTKYEVWSARRK